MRSSVTVGRFIEIPIEIHYSFPPVFAFVTWLLVTRFFPVYLPGRSVSAHWILGLLGSSVLFGSVLAHEFGHAVVARWFGRPVRYVRLFALGGLIEVEVDELTPGEEFRMALAGPMVSLLLGALNAVGWLLVGPDQSILWSLFLYLALSNLLLGLFNLLPGYPLDGGRMLRAALWYWSGDRDQAERWTNWLGLGLGGLFLALGGYGIFADRPLGGFWLAAVGVFLLVTILQTPALAAAADSPDPE